MTAHETVSVPGTSAGVGRAAAAFDEFCRDRGVPPEARWRFQVALDEILSNIVRHGYKDAGGTIALTFTHDGRAVSVEVVDSGPAFDPRQAPPPDTSSPLESRRPGGLGIVLAEELLDELAYERRDEHNHLKLTWRMRRDEPGAGRRTKDGHGDC
ncbi:MAG TPA: ATP-binding protein [Vicinamibacterales bacterium]|nr:ATP-binding protein [Vicinamibacterales bacterium]